MGYLKHILIHEVGETSVSHCLITTLFGEVFSLCVLHLEYPQNLGTSREWGGGDLSKKEIENIVLIRDKGESGKGGLNEEVHWRTG